MKLSSILLLSMLSASVTVTGQIVHNKRVVPIKKKDKIPVKTLNDSAKIPKPLNKTAHGYYCPPCGKG